MRSTRRDIVSSCCGAPIYDDDDICSDCGEHCSGIQDCELCGGTGNVDIVDYDRVTGKTISPPYKTIKCPECNGEGFNEIDL